MPKPARVVLAVMLAAAPGIAQAPPQATGPGAGDIGRMFTPTPISGEGYSMEFAAETPRTNYVTGGLTFSSAYDDNIGSVQNNKPIADVSYSIWPTIGLNQSRSRLSWDFSYSPGFTFYQKNTQLNQTNHNANLDFQYRLSPHITLSVVDTFRKTSDALSQAGQNSGNSGIGGVANPPITVIAPVADQISNNGAVSLSYQFAANAMAGASGIFSLLEFPNPSQAVGLSNSHVRGGDAFYSHRFAGRHYIGTTYRYQDISATQNLGTSLIGSETVSHSFFGFYTFFLKPTISFSFNGGPERANTNGVVQWSPSFGGSMGWQGTRTSVAVSAARRISGGNGLSGAAHSSTADASLRRKLSSHLTAGIGTNYSDNKVLGSVNLLNTNGHVLSGRVSLELVLKDNFGLETGYTRIHQDYSNISGLIGSPDRDRVWVSLSYQFRRPIGR